MINGDTWRPLVTHDVEENISNNRGLATPTGYSVIKSEASKEHVIEKLSLKSHSSCCYRLYCAFARCLTDIYFWACLVYLVYTCQALAADYCKYVKIHEHQCTSSNINDQFVGLAAVHCFNAFQYFSCWGPFFREQKNNLSKSTLVTLLIPEFMNIIEGGMYLFSSLSYERLEESSKCEEDLECEGEIFLHHWETGAASVECLASLFWCYSWYVVFNIDTPSTLSNKEKILWALFDPELYSALLLVAGSVVYIVYYLQVDEYPNHYDTNMLWETGDIIYFIGALLYLISAMKLCGCFYYVKLPGWTDDWHETDCSVEHSESSVIDTINPIAETLEDESRSIGKISHRPSGGANATTSSSMTVSYNPLNSNSFEVLDTTLLPVDGENEESLVESDRSEAENGMEEDAVTNITV